MWFPRLPFSIARELGDIPALFGVKFCIVMGMSDGVEKVRWSLRSKAAGAGWGLHAS